MQEEKERRLEKKLHSQPGMRELASIYGVLMDKSTCGGPSRGGIRQAGRQRRRRSRRHPPAEQQSGGNLQSPAHPQTQHCASPQDETALVVSQLRRSLVRETLCP